MITDYIDKDKVIQYLDEHLSEKRRRHIKGVVETAVSLAKQYGADPERQRRERSTMTCSRRETWTT